MARAEGSSPRETSPPLLTPPPRSSQGRSARAPLPTDHRPLPPLGDAFEGPLRAGLASLGLDLPEPMHAAMEAQGRLLVAWSGAINLTTHRSPGAIALEHVLDSLAAHRLVRDTDAIIDLGSGAGYPGLPLAVCLPVARVALVESIAKKARFLEAAAAAAAAELRRGDEPVPVIDVVAMRAEDLARDDDHREAWDLVTARALARTDELVELALPLSRLGGRLVAWKRDDGTGALARELEAARQAIRICGGTRPEVHRVTLPGLEDHRLVVIGKRRPTPRHLPRSPAERRRPLLR